MVEPEILAYYERNDERDRLASGGRRIEFLRVWDLLVGDARSLAAADASVDAVLLFGPAKLVDRQEAGGATVSCHSTRAERLDAWRADGYDLEVPGRDVMHVHPLSGAAHFGAAEEDGVMQGCPELVDSPR
jgi:hypothetical protein